MESLAMSSRIGLIPANLIVVVLCGCDDGPSVQFNGMSAID